MYVMKVSVLVVFCLLVGVLDEVFSYERPPAGRLVHIPRSQNLGSTSPQQVHISLVGKDKMRISWITDDFSTPAIVQYSTTPGAKNGILVNGTTSSYEYVTYTSGQIHEVVIGPLKPSTIYYYQCGLDSTLQFNFTTPPAQLPLKFTIAGDLGQTDWTESTLQHVSKSNYDIFLLPGDLSYADDYQPLWDSFGRLVEPLAQTRPWMVTQGNHEVETMGGVHSEPFTSYNARWRMPFEESGSTSNLYYSFEVAVVHVVMLGSYDDFNPGSDQYNWLKSNLAKVDRGITPWLVVLIHAPWYNSNYAHQNEHESVDMKKDMEEILYEARVDVIFTGHVHAYERFTRVYKDEANKCGIVHITIGDGGNREGLATKYMNPQPEISIFREASFGHGELNVVNETHAEWSWHRNEDDESVISDSIWLRNLSKDPSCNA